MYNNFIINTHQHYLKHSYYDKPFQHILYTCEQKSLFETIQRPVVEAVNAAKLIADKSTQKILIPLSGGIDSETTALSFLKAGIAFTPIILKFENNMNDYDIIYAIEFCKTHKLNYKIISIDLDWFFSKDYHLEYAEKYFCRSPQLALMIWLIENTDGHIIFSYNPLPIIKNGTKLRICAPPMQYHCFDHYFSKNSRPGIGLFHLYTYELMISFFKLKLYKECLLSPRFLQTFSWDNYIVKSELYRDGGFDLTARPTKWTGFEKYRNYLNFFHHSEKDDFFDMHYRRPMEVISKDQNLECFIDLNLTGLFFSENKTDKR